MSKINRAEAEAAIASALWVRGMGSRAGGKIAAGQILTQLEEAGIASFEPTPDRWAPFTTAELDLIFDRLPTGSDLSQELGMVLFDRYQKGA